MCVHAHINEDILQGSFNKLKIEGHTNIDENKLFEST